MAAKVPRWRKFTQLVSNHILSNVHRHMPPAIVHGNGVPYHIRKYGGGARPRTQDAFLPGIIHILNASQQLLVDEWPFFQ
jgi:hypothetical protein